MLVYSIFYGPSPSIIWFEYLKQIQTKVDRLVFFFVDKLISIMFFIINFKFIRDK
jgi:hypothetical protein